MSLSTSPADSRVRHTEHRITVQAPVRSVYEVIADVTGWPAIFTPTVHAERLEFDGTEERIRLWATANGEVKTWISRRVLDPERLRVEFRQEVSQSPVAAMGGAWIFEQRPDGGTDVLLTHDYTAVSDVPDAEEWIAKAVDRNSTVELAALKAFVEPTAVGDPILTFEDTVRIAAPAASVYEFLYRAESWRELLPHVSRVVLDEPVPGIQRLEMDTTAPNGATHTTASFRVALEGDRIAYKQVVLPPLLTLHLGCWTITEAEDGGVAAVSRHTVRINPEKLSLLGEGTDLDAAKAYIRNALSTNSTTTLMHAKAHTEAPAS
jgi:aromatase